jgi:hypothetical protein
MEKKMPKLCCTCGKTKYSRIKGREIASEMLFKPIPLFFGGFVKFPEGVCSKCFMRGFLKKVRVLTRSCRAN